MRRLLETYAFPARDVNNQNLYFATESLLREAKELYIKNNPHMSIATNSLNFRRGANVFFADGEERAIIEVWVG